MKIFYNFNLNSSVLANEKPARVKTTGFSDFALHPKELPEASAPVEKIHSFVSYENYQKKRHKHSECKTCRNRALLRHSDTQGRGSEATLEFESGICPECGCSYIINNSNHQFVNASNLSNIIKNGYLTNSFSGTLSKYVGGRFDTKI